jgi:hypothetical protein
VKRVGQNGVEDSNQGRPPLQTAENRTPDQEKGKHTKKRRTADRRLAYKTLETHKKPKKAGNHRIEKNPFCGSANGADPDNPKADQNPHQKGRIDKAKPGFSEEVRETLFRVCEIAGDER